MKMALSGFCVCGRYGKGNGTNAAKSLNYTLLQAALAAMNALALYANGITKRETKTNRESLVSFE